MQKYNEEEERRGEVGHVVMYDTLMVSLITLLD